MNETKHSSLPWRRCGGATPHFMAIHSPDGYIVFGMADGYYDIENGQAIHVPTDIVQIANAKYIVRACNAHEDLLAACRNHDFTMGPDSASPNPYGTFADALRNLAAELPATDRMNDWAEWLRKKAFALNAAVYKAEQLEPNGEQYDGD